MVVLTLTVAAPVVNVPHSAGAAESSKASPRAGLNLQERIIGPGSKPRSLEVDGDDYRIRVGAIGRHVLHRGNGAAYLQGLGPGVVPVHVWANEDVTLRLPVFNPAHAPLPILQATIALPTRLASLRLFMMMCSLA